MRDGETNFDFFRTGRECSREGDRIHIGANAVEVMLGQPDRVDAEPVAELRLGNGFADNAAVVVRTFGGGEDEVAELTIEY